MNAIKKNSLPQWIILAIYMVAGVAVGILAMEYMDQFFTESNSLLELLIIYVLLIFSAYIALTVQTIIHEGGHLLFGLLTGYRFTSFRIFSWMLIREEGQIALKHLSLTGTAGQCLMAPPRMKDGKIPFVLYNLGGVLANLFFSVLFFIIAGHLSNTSFATVLLKIFAVIGITFALINGIPLRTNMIDNDGMNVVSLKRSLKAVYAFWLQLEMNSLMAQGKRLKDMPEEWFEMPEEEEMQNGLIAARGVLYCDRQMDERRFKEAREAIEHLLSIESAVAPLHLGLLKCNLIYLLLMEGNQEEAVSQLLDKEQRKLMRSMKSYPSVVRTEYALAMLLDHDATKAEEIRDAFDRHSDTFPYPSEVKAENELMDMVKNKGE